MTQTLSSQVYLCIDVFISLVKHFKKTSCFYMKYTLKDMVQDILYLKHTDCFSLHCRLCVNSVHDDSARVWKRGSKPCAATHISAACITLLSFKPASNELHPHPHIPFFLPIPACYPLFLQLLSPTIPPKKKKNSQPPILSF